MVLPNAVLIPNALLPLRIFEPQYREMLRWCLERDRFFCIAFKKAGEPDAAPENFSPVGGLGLVRACVGVEDGTSNLILQGLIRVKFGNLLQTDPFRLAEIREFPSDCQNIIEAEALGTKVMEICRDMRIHEGSCGINLIQKLRDITDPELLADIVTQTFVRDPAEQQRLMEERSVAARMRHLIRYLQET